MRASGASPNGSRPSLPARAPDPEVGNPPRSSRQFIAETCIKQSIAEGELTLHADRGSSMKSKLVAQLLADLGVTKTHSRRWRVSDDNPFSEAQFRTMKYRPRFPERFGSIHDSRGFCHPFFDWYNHHHSGIGLHTPHSVHYGLAQAIQLARQQTLLAAHATHPERFVNKLPAPPLLPDAVWINPPKQTGDPPDYPPVLH